MLDIGIIERMLDVLVRETLHAELKWIKAGAYWMVELSEPLTLVVQVSKSSGSPHIIIEDEGMPEAHFDQFLLGLELCKKVVVLQRTIERAQIAVGPVEAVQEWLSKLESKRTKSFHDSKSQ